MQISARNVIAGTLVSIETGAVTAPVKIGIAPGRVVTAAITNDAVASLKLEVGTSAYAVVKASDVMIAVD